jgi:DUF4097 and DUF4098 domain-containing protein YvlB
MKTDRTHSSLLSFGPRLSLSLACLLAATAQALGADVEGNLQKSFAVEPGGRLVVDADRGSIEIKTSKGSQVEVEVFRKVTRASDARAKEILGEHKVDFAQEGNTVTVRARRKTESRGFWNLGSTGLDVRYVITVPEKFDADLKTSGGGIKVADLAGEVKARTSGGSITLGRIQGPVHGSTSGGSVYLAGFRGVAQIQTSGGNIEIADGDGNVSAETSGGSIHAKSVKGNLTAHTSGGGITVQKVEGNLNATTSGGSISAVLIQPPTADCRLETSGGSITVKLGANVAFDVDAQTSGGGVSSELPVTTTVSGKPNRNSLKGKVNGGGRSLVLRTSGGNIHLNKL